MGQDNQPTDNPDQDLQDFEGNVENDGGENSNTTVAIHNEVDISELEAYAIPSNMVLSSDIISLLNCSDFKLSENEIYTINPEQLQQLKDELLLANNNGSELNEINNTDFTIGDVDSGNELTGIPLTFDTNGMEKNGRIAENESNNDKNDNGSSPPLSCSSSQDVDNATNSNSTAVLPSQKGKKPRGRKPKRIKELELSEIAAAGTDVGTVNQCQNNKATRSNSRAKEKKPETLTVAPPNVVIHHKASNIRVNEIGMNANRNVCNQQQLDAGPNTMTFHAAHLSNSNSTDSSFPITSSQYRNRYPAVTICAGKHSAHNDVHNSQMTYSNNGENSSRTNETDQITRTSRNHPYSWENEAQSEHQPRYQNQLPSDQQNGSLEQLFTDRISGTGANRRSTVAPSYIQRNRSLYNLVTAPAPKGYQAGTEFAKLSQDKWMQYPNPSGIPPSGGNRIAGTASGLGPSCIQLDKQGDSAYMCADTTGQRVQSGVKDPGMVNPGSYQQNGMNSMGIPSGGGGHCRVGGVVGHGDNRAANIVDVDDKFEMAPLSSQDIAQRMLNGRSNVGGEPYGSRMNSGSRSYPRNNNRVGFTHIQEMYSQCQAMHRENNDLKTKLKYLGTKYKISLNRLEACDDENEALKCELSRMRAHCRTYHRNGPMNMMPMHTNMQPMMNPYMEEPFVNFSRFNRAPFGYGYGPEPQGSSLNHMFNPRGSRQFDYYGYGPGFPPASMYSGSGISAGLNPDPHMHGNVSGNNNSNGTNGMPNDCVPANWSNVKIKQEPIDPPENDEDGESQSRSSETFEQLTLNFNTNQRPEHAPGANKPALKRNCEEDFKIAEVAKKIKTEDSKYNNEDTNLQNEIAQSGDEAGIVPASLSLGSGRSESRTLADQLRQFTEKKLQETKQRNSVIRLEKVNN